MKYGVLALLVACGASLLLGEVWINPFALSGLERSILLEVRLPRMLLAALLGAGLGLSGATMQGYLRNPLAEPGLLGVGNGAALGAVLALYSGLAGLLPFSAIAGGVLAWCGCAWLSRQNSTGGTASIHTLILAGIAISSLLGAGVALALNLTRNPFVSMEAMFWLMGSLEYAKMSDVGFVLPWLAVGVVLLLRTGQSLDALSLGEGTAQSLGIRLSRLSWQIGAGVALCVSAGVAVAGSIGFVGLVAPHMLRPLAKHVPSRLLPLSAIGGALLLLISDIAVRLIPTSGMELRLGVVTAFIGAPYLLYLLFREGRRLW